MASRTHPPLSVVVELQLMLDANAGGWPWCEFAVVAGLAEPFGSIAWCAVDGFMHFAVCGTEA